MDQLLTEECSRIVKYGPSAKLQTFTNHMLGNSRPQKEQKEDPGRCLPCPRKGTDISPL